MTIGAMRKKDSPVVYCMSLQVFPATRGRVDLTEIEYIATNTEDITPATWGARESESRPQTNSGDDIASYFVGGRVRQKQHGCLFVGVKPKSCGAAAKRVCGDLTNPCVEKLSSVTDPRTKPHMTARHEMRTTGLGTCPQRR